MFKRLLILLCGLLVASLCIAAEPATPAAAPAAARTWVAGTDYFPIDPPVPTSSGSKVEVVEVFSYACPHCAHFQPYVDELKSKLPANSQLVLLPAVFNPGWEPFARAFYTAQSMGLVDKTHQALFDALHRDHMPINSIETLANFYAGFGANTGTFQSNASSFVIEAKLAHGNDLVRDYHVDATPTLIINGKYRVTAVAERGIGFPEMEQIALSLVQQESAAKHPKK